MSSYGPIDLQSPAFSQQNKPAVNRIPSVHAYATFSSGNEYSTVLTSSSSTVFDDSSYTVIDQSNFQQKRLNVDVPPTPHDSRPAPELYSVISFQDASLSLQQHTSVSQQPLSDGYKPGYRDWNSEFQSLFDRIRDDDSVLDQELAFTQLSHLVSDFEACATSIARIIIAERDLDESLRSIKPKKLGGIAGGLKFCELVSNL